jgi:hypothetical protein
VALGEVLRAAVGGERPDVPRADAEDVGHFREGFRSATVRLG